MTRLEAEEYLALEPAVFQHRVLLLNVNRTFGEKLPYEAVRYAWKIDPSKAAQAKVVLATCKGKIVGAFVAHRWLEVTAENFPNREPLPGRYGFEGQAVSEDIHNLYVGKRVPDEYRKRGASNPVRYIWQTDDRL